MDNFAENHGQDTWYDATTLDDVQHGVRRLISYSGKTRLIRTVRGPQAISGDYELVEEISPRDNAIYG